MAQPPPLPPSAPERPTSVIVIAALGALFGVLGLACLPMGLLPYVADFGPPNPVVEAVKANTPLLVYTIASMILGVFLAIALLAGSVGALMWQPWARLTLIGYASVALFFSVVGAAVHFLVMMPLMTEVMDPAIAGAAKFGAMFGSCAICFQFAYQGAVLFVMTRPEVKRAFEGGR